jgi:hypothetical protein
MRLLRQYRHLWYIPASLAIFLLVLGLEYAYAYRPEQAVSFELDSARSGGSPRVVVATWLARHRSDIVLEAKRWHVDPLAIAGVVAFEGLENPLPSQFSTMFRAVGPGKVHYKEFYLSEGDPVSKQVEDDGYLPHRTESQRKAILETDRGSLDYIGAIMRLFVDRAAAEGFDIRNSPAILTTLYSAWSPKEFEAYLKSARGRSHQFEPNGTGAWVQANADYVRAALARGNM